MRLRFLRRASYEDWGRVEAAVHQEDVLFDGCALEVELAGDAGSGDADAVFRDLAREGIARAEAEVAEELGSDLAVLARVFRRALSVAEEHALPQMQFIAEALFRRGEGAELFQSAFHGQCLGSNARLVSEACIAARGAQRPGLGLAHGPKGFETLGLRRAMPVSNPRHPAHPRTGRS